MAIVIPLTLLIYVPLLIMISFLGGFDGPGFHSVNHYYGNNFEPPILWIIIYCFVLFIVVFIIQSLSFGMIAHFFRVCKKADTGLPEKTGNYFVFLKGKNLIKVISLSIVSFLISVVAVVLCYLPIFYMMVPLHLLQVIFAFNEKLSVSELIRASFKLGNKYWLVTFGLLIIASLIAQVGILLCFIGVIFTAYFVHIPIYYLYEDTVGFEDEIDEIKF